MKIRDFGVEIWMNAYETRCELNLAETCVESLTVAELLEMADKTDSILSELLPLKLTYGAIEGSDRLRDLVAGLYDRQARENVVITHGAIGANALVHETLVGPGDRVMPHLRFLNAQDGRHIQKWQFKRKTTPIKPIGSAGKTITHYHLAPEDWEDLPGGEQRLCYNEIPTKVNWHYLRFDFDLAAMQATRFQVNDRVFAMDGYDCIRIPAMKNLWCMLNLAFFAETDTDKRAFAYLDSVCLSGDF